MERRHLGSDHEYMLDAAIRSTSDLAADLLTWTIANAVTMLFISVITAVVTEMAVRLLRRRSIDLLASTTSVTAGIAYITAKGIVSKLLVFGLAMYIYDHHRIFDPSPTNLFVWLTVFVCRDFIYYWIHRAEHQVKVLWASHMVHHSSEEFSFTTAVRMPWMEALYKPALSLWAPLLGFHPAAFAAMGALVLIAGQFQHTELMRRRTVLDHFFVTPSAHRVHHGSNPEYLDKNFGSMLIIWDRMFGTYEPEVSSVTYGLTGTTTVRSPREALVGGYRTLAGEIAPLGPRASFRHLLARP